MHKYHIADALTFTEFVMAGVIILFTIYGVDSGWALIVFAIGELCDAFDGICARTWHYPDDGKRRWWREHAPIIDQISDVVLGLVTLVYTILWTNTELALLLTMTALGIAIPIQIIVNDMNRKIRRHKLRENSRRLVDSIVLFRRHLYLVGIAGVVLLLVFYAPWDPLVREFILGIGVLIGLALWIIKADRRTQNKTPL